MSQVLIWASVFISLNVEEGNFEKKNTKNHKSYLFLVIK